jgi:hypothetical protein
MIQTILKRDGRRTEFDIEKISTAIYKAAQAAGGHDHAMAQQLAGQVVEYIEHTLKEETPTVELIQDAVEKVLIENGHAITARISSFIAQPLARAPDAFKCETFEDLTLATEGQRHQAWNATSGRYRHGHHAQVWLRKCQAVLSNVYPLPRAFRGARFGGYPYPRYGFLYADHHLLSD